jgi:hypothetical protein
MNASHRLGLLVAAVVVLVVAFVLLGTGGDDTATTPTTQPAAETTGGTEAPAEEEEAPAPKPKPEPRVERIEAPVSGDPKTLRYERGDTIRPCSRSTSTATTASSPCPPGARAR